MPKGDPIACVLCGLASILLLIMAALAYSMRPAEGKPSSTRKIARSHLLIGISFGLKSAQECHPYPKDIHNPFTAAFGGLLIFALVYAVQEIRDRRKARGVTG